MSRLDAIVREIVTELHDQPIDKWEYFGAEVGVRATIGILRELDRETVYRGASKGRMPIRGKRQENIEDFSVLLKQVKALQKALSKTSVPALLLLFSGENDDLGTDQFPSVAVQKRVFRRLQQVTMALATMRGRCDLFLAKRPGAHGNAQYRQRRVAHEAWRLLRRHRKTPAGGTPGSLYGDIASLLWEAMTGEVDKDLQRACKTALRLAGEGGLHDDGNVIGHGQIATS
jgi:hypothetical protein